MGHNPDIRKMHVAYQVNTTTRDGNMIMEIFDKKVILTSGYTKEKDIPNILELVHNCPTGGSVQIVILAATEV